MFAYIEETCSHTRFSENTSSQLFYFEI